MLTSAWAREWQYKDILTAFDDQVWKDLSEEWQKYLLEKEESPCLRLETSGESERSPVSRVAGL